jgi:hypothetical protein
VGGVYPVHTVTHFTYNRLHAASGFVDIYVAKFPAVNHQNLIHMLPGVFYFPDQLTLQFRDILVQTRRRVQQVLRIKKSLISYMVQFKTQGATGNYGDICK